jgi:hypothetical protein
VVRTSVSQDRVVATLVRNCSSTISIYSSSRISDGQPCGGGEDTDSQNDTFVEPSWVPHLLAGPH